MEWSGPSAGVVALFVPDKNLRDLVMSYLRNSESSISGVARQLQKDGHRLHRLFLTGYLKALADMGMVKEKEIPPAKVYTIASRREKNLYEAVGERCRARVASEDEAAVLALAVLQRLFHRPIFLRELRACGFTSGPRVHEIDGPRREDARRALGKVKVLIPTNELAYAMDSDVGAVRDEVIAQVLVERFAAMDLVVPTVQGRLPEGGKAQG